MVAHRHNLSQLEYGTHERILGPPPAYTPIAMQRDVGGDWDETVGRRYYPIHEGGEAPTSRRVRFSDGQLDLPPLYHAGTGREMEMPPRPRRATVSVIGEEREDEFV